MVLAKGHVDTALEGVEEQCRKEKEENERWRRSVIEHESNLRKAQDSIERCQAQVTATEKQVVDAQMALKQANEDLLMSRQKQAELTAMAGTDDDVKKSLRQQLEEYKRTSGLDKDHIASLNFRISELETLVESETNKCGRLTAKLDESAIVRTRIEHTVSDLETQCSQQQEQIVLLTKQLNDLHIASKQRETGLENTIKSTQAELTTSTETLRSDVLMGNNKVTALLAAKALAEQCISDLEASTTGLTQENVHLKHQLQELKGEKNKTKQQTQSLQEENVDFQAQLVALQTSSSKSIVDLQIQLKQSNDESAMLSASNVSSKALMDKQIDALKDVLAKSNDESTETMKRYMELTNAKAAADKDISDLKKQLIDNASDANQRIGFLEGQIGLLQKQLNERKAELVVLQTSSSKSIADLQTQLETTRIELLAMSNQHQDLITRSTKAKTDADQLIETLRLANTNDQTELTRVRALLHTLQEEHDAMIASAAAALEKQQADYESTIADLRQNLDSQRETASIELATLEARLYEECDAWEQEYSALHTRFEDEQSLLQAASLRITSMAETMQERRRASFASTSILDNSNHSTSLLIATVPPISPPPPIISQMASSVSDRRVSVSSSFSIPPSPVGRLMSSRNPTGSRNSSMMMQMSSEKDSMGDGNSSVSTVGRSMTPRFVMDGITAAKAAVTGGVTTVERGTSYSSPTLMSNLFTVGEGRDVSTAASSKINAGAESIQAEAIAQALLSENMPEISAKEQRLDHAAQGLSEKGITSSTTTNASAPAVNESLLAVQTTMESLETTLLDKFSHLEAVLSGNYPRYPLLFLSPLMGTLTVLCLAVAMYSSILSLLMNRLLPLWYPQQLPMYWNVRTKKLTQ